MKKILSLTLITSLALISFPKQAQAFNLGNVSNLYNQFSQWIEQFTNYELPNWEEIQEQAMNGNNQSEGQEQSAIYEGKTVPTYRMRMDTAEYELREQTSQYAQESTLSEDAQEATQEELDALQENLETQQNLSEDSQNSDTTQQILQNVSKQLALSSEQQGYLIQNAKKNSVDQATQILLFKQQAEHIAQETTAKRREANSTYNSIIGQAGLVTINTFNNENNNINQNLISQQPAQ
ncbi:hypothetical protein [Chroococcus sp. FPU101]|uniref:hypothetical protein n=1 Tax=Chroococcus sp. FPU101 TaxID=1974212 RepID=UPI001A8CA968|nr:hypothetical protein [Chroococcus sp. FPU101]GFE69099.1 hypothetical protein CFPU101_17090 [Chroococcus sp. FPU101]